MRTIAQELGSITVGDPVHFEGLTIFPLFRDGPVPPEPDYTLLEEAVARGGARVTEVAAEGSVPELRFENLGEKPVLLLDGEELIGAKQNRVVNLTILAPAKQVIVIPVSCVEAGRWHAESKDFRPAEHVMYSRARAAKGAQVSFSMVTSDTRRADQSAIWEEIASKCERVGAASPTQAMNAMYDSRAVSLDAYLRAFAWAEHQAGVVFAIGQQTMGLDLMDHPHTMRAMLPKLVRSYALDAVEAPHSVAATAAQAAQFLDRIGKSEPLIRPAVGIGEDVRLTGEGVREPLSGPNSDTFTSARLPRMEPTAPEGSARASAARHAGAPGKREREFMWIFTRYGFYSVVCARNQDSARPDTDTLMVRARVRHHLEKLQNRFAALAGCSIRETPDTDYRYRIIVPKACWRDVVVQMVEEISYANFKDEAARSLGFGGRDYIHALHDVWSRLYDLQEQKQQ